MTAVGTGSEADQSTVQDGVKDNAAIARNNLMG